MSGHSQSHCLRIIIIVFVAVGIFLEFTSLHSVVQIKKNPQNYGYQARAMETRYGTHHTSCKIGAPKVWLKQRCSLQRDFSKYGTTKSAKKHDRPKYSLGFALSSPEWFQIRCIVTCSTRHLLPQRERYQAKPKHD